jgi:hypothetical protein
MSSADRPGTEPLDEEERRRRALELGDDIARRYDPARLSRVVVEQAGRGERLELATRGAMERRLGGDFGAVRVFRGPFAEAVTRRHRADAVTVGNTGMVLVREGPRADPKSAAGQALLAHELTHVAQAQRGMHLASDPRGARDTPAERDAEEVEAQVHAEATGQAEPRTAAVDPAVQRERVIERVLELIEERHRVAVDRSG